MPGPPAFPGWDGPVGILRHRPADHRRRERRPDGERDARANDAVGTEHAVVEVGDVHGAALALAHAGAATEELRHHLSQPDALGDAVAMTSVGRRHISQPFIIALMTQALELTGKEKVLELGADEAFGADDPALRKLPEIRGEKLDAVIDAVGREEIINASLPLLKMAAKACIYGVIDKPAITLEKHAGPYNFNLLIHQWPTRKWEAAAQEQLCEWIREGTLSYRDFLSGEFPVDEVQAAFEAVKSAAHVKTLLRW